jgi:hypothetical protein
MPSPETERRRSKRFQIEIPVIVKAQDGTERKCTTKDLSTGGVFFHCDLKLVQDSPIQLVMILPPEITGGQKHQWICCSGRVARVQKDLSGGQHGVAVKVERLAVLPEITA